MLPILSMITIYCNGKVHYRREDRSDLVVQETCHLMAYQNQVFGKSAYSIDWGDAAEQSLELDREKAGRVLA